MSVSRSAFYHIPLFGWLLKDAAHGAPDAKYYFVWNVFVFIALAVYAFGYPLLICLALIAAAAALSMLVVLTAGDLFDEKDRLARAAVSRKEPRRE